MEIHWREAKNKNTRVIDLSFTNSERECNSRLHTERRADAPSNSKHKNWRAVTDEMTLNKINFLIGPEYSYNFDRLYP